VKNGANARVGCVAVDDEAFSEVGQLEHGCCCERRLEGVERRRGLGRPPKRLSLQEGC
jgi:hypothetical protein